MLLFSHSTVQINSGQGDSQMLQHSSFKFTQLPT